VTRVTEGGEEMAEEVLEDDEKVEIVTEAQNEWMEGMELQDLTIEAVPQSPTPSVLLSDTACTPSSDAGVGTTDVGDPATDGDEGMCLAGFGVVGANQSCGFTKQPKKRAMGSDDEDGGECVPIRKPQKKRVKGSGDENGRDHALSRSAEASRKLKESLRSGTFVADEKKRGRFEGKCRGLDRHAKFGYKASWQVRHSKCSKWITMQELYNLTRFKEHIDGCRQMGEKGRNGTIDLFFKPRDAKETGTTMIKMAQPSARKQIFVGADAKRRETLIEPDLPPIQFISKERPCLGLRKDQDERIERYISRVTVEGGGSHSDTHITRKLFGIGVKYSELDDDSKHYVATAQVHAQKWKISHTLGAVFSTNCKGTVVVMSKTQSSTCDQCLCLLKLHGFKKALDVQPPSLDNLKFTPHRHRNAAINLGMNLAKIEGLSSLLEKVSWSCFRNLIWGQ
jgi:hypothetical protein